VANDEPRDQPRELYPEWTTRPHAPHALKDLPPPGTPRRGPGRTGPGGLSWRGFTVVLLSLVAIVGLLLFRVDARRLDRTGPRTGPASTADAELEKNAQNRVLADPELARLPVVITVTDQVVMVTGPVPDATTRDKLLFVVRMTPGAKGVVDRSTITTQR
jgi:hypothetical protein